MTPAAFAAAILRRVSLSSAINQPAIEIFSGHQRRALRQVTLEGHRRKAGVHRDGRRRQLANSEQIDEVS